MIESDSIDISVTNLWRSWRKFRRGKKPTKEILQFSSNLEHELFILESELRDRSYHHGGYKEFVVNEKKRRIIRVATVKDRLVHRLLYDYLVSVFDRRFIFDAWSCRENKGLYGAVLQARQLLKQSRDEWIWQADVDKFFDNIVHRVLKDAIARVVDDNTALWLCGEVIDSYWDDAGEQADSRRALPIGNLTSQVMANIYLNELDRYISHTLKPKGYIRYGDDILLLGSREVVKKSSRAVEKYLGDILGLTLNDSAVFRKAAWGVNYLGCRIYPNGVALSSRNTSRIADRLNPTNCSSYWGMGQKYGSLKQKEGINWRVGELIKLNDD